MKAIVYGQERMAKKLMAFLAGEGVMVEEASDKFYETMAWSARGQFDLAIVDSQAETAEAACHHIRKSWDIPLVLIVNSRQADWKGLKLIDADGYLPERTEDSELVARLRAVLRRFRPAGQIEKTNFVTEPLRILLRS